MTLVTEQRVTKSDTLQGSLLEAQRTGQREFVVRNLTSLYTAEPTDRGAILAAAQAALDGDLSWPTTRDELARLGLPWEIRNPRATLQPLSTEPIGLLDMLANVVTPDPFTEVDAPNYGNPCSAQVVVLLQRTL